MHGEALANEGHHLGQVEDRTQISLQQIGDPKGGDIEDGYRDVVSKVEASDSLPVDSVLLGNVDEFPNSRP